MTRLLMAGTGLIGRRHLAHIMEHPDLTLVGIIDPVVENHALAPVPGFTDLASVNVEADGIVLATPTESHAPLTIAAAQRGWHVLVEKPLAESLEAADRMIEAATTAGTQILVGHHRRHHPRVAQLKALLDSGAIGRPVLGSMIWAMRKNDGYFDVDWRAGMTGAPVKQNLIHDVDLLRYFLGEITDVTGLGGNPVRGEARTESGGAVLAFDSGAIVTIAFADTTPSPWGWEAGSGENPNIGITGQDCLRIMGTEGAVEFPNMRLWTGAKDWHEAAQCTQLETEHSVPLVTQLEHFADVIHGRAAPLVSAKEGRATLAATLAIETATRPKGIVA